MANEATMLHFTRRQPLFTQKPPGFSSFLRRNVMKPGNLHLSRKPCLLSRSLRALVMFAPSVSGGLKSAAGTFVCYAPMILQVSLCENGSFKTRRSKGKNLQLHHIGIMVAGLILTASQNKSRRNQHDGLLIKMIVAKKVRSSATMLCIRPYIIRGFQPGFYKTGQCKHLCQYIIKGKENKQ